jgi:hypothetical protein
LLAHLVRGPDVVGDVVHDVDGREQVVRRGQAVAGCQGAGSQRLEAGGGARKVECVLGEQAEWRCRLGDRLE